MVQSEYIREKEIEFSMNAKTLGEFVAALRQEKGLTQKQLADRLGVTDKAVSRWEKGKNYPDIELLEPIAREFEVTVNELISGRRLGSGEILPESDSNIVHIIKINRRQKRIFSMVLALLLVFILIFGLYTIGRFSGLNSQPVRKTYDIYQNYLTAVLKEIEGRIYELSSGEGSWDTLYISEADVLFSPEKEINASAPMVSHLSVICSGNRSDRAFLYEVSVYPSRSESDSPVGGQKLHLDICKYICDTPKDSTNLISLDTFIQVTDAISINSIFDNTSETDFFSLRYCGTRNGEDIDLSINPAEDYILDGNTVRHADSDEIFSDYCAFLTLDGFTPLSAGGGYESDDEAKAFIWVPQY